MPEQPYTKRELDNLVKGIDEKLERIETQVKYTNSRVKALELWRAATVGGISVIVVLLVPIIVYIVQKGL